MAEPATTLEVVSDDEAAGFVLAAGLAGWVADTEAASLSSLARQLEHRRAELAELEARYNERVAEACEAGRLEARAEVEAIAQEAAAASDRLVAKATALAVELATMLVESELQTRPDAIAPMVEAILARRGARPPRRLRVHASLVAAVRSRYPGHEVVADPRCGLGDVCVDYDDGKVETTLTRLMSGFGADLEEELRDG